MMIRRFLPFFLGISGLLAIGFSLPRNFLEPALHYSGYYFILVAFFLWILFILKLSYHQFRSFITSHYPAVLLSTGLMCLIFFSHPPSFKILADEANLVGVSMAMHENKTASLPVQGLALDYAVFNPDYKLDKRPLLFPFFISLVHSIAGYSPYNGYVVNFILGVSILFMTYLLVSSLFSKFYGTLGILILSSYPIFIIWVTSSGFDMLNLFLMVFLFLALYYYLYNPSHDHAILFYLSLVLLVQCRYESLVFVLILLFLIPHMVKNKLIFRHGVISYIIPLLLLPVIWQRRLFANSLEPVRVGHGLFESAGQLFDIANLGANLSKNIFVISGMDSRFGFLPMISIMAVLGWYLLIKQCCLEFSSIDKRIKLFSLTGVVFTLSLFFIHSLYFWGNYAGPTSNRFALVFLPLLIIATIFFLNQTFENPGNNTKVVIILLAIVQFLYFKPVAEKQWILKGLSLTHEYSKTSSCLSSNYDATSDNLLIISDLPSLYFIHGVGSVDFQYANQNTDKIKFFHQAYYDHIIVLQRCTLKDNQPGKQNRLNDKFQMTQVGRINISPEFFIKISEVKRML